MLRVVLCFGLLGLLRAAGDAHGQSGPTDVLTGRILDPRGRPVADAVVTATSLATERRRSTLSDEEGRYRLTLPRGGRYALRAVKIRMAHERILQTTASGGNLLVADIRLRDTPVVLEGLTIIGEGDELETTGVDHDLPAEWLALLPVDRSTLTTVASLAPGTVGLETSDSIGSGGFSVFGQRPDLNHVSVDGASFGSPRGGADGSLGLPPEAVRLTRVITNSYDVARGQYSGAQIAATTRGGSNRSQGTATYTLYEPRLQWDAGGAPMRGGYTEHALGGSYGGPLVKDRAFYFLSGSARHRSQDFASLLQADAAALEQLGAHPDSVARFLDILQSHGLSPRESVPVSGQLIEELLLFGRFDLTLSKKHSLMVRLDGRLNSRDGTRVASLGLPHSGGADAGSGGGVMLGLTSTPARGITNQLRAYLSRSDTDALPYLPIPEGRVRVASRLPDGTRSVASLVFGGNRSLPVTSMERTLEISDELSWRIGVAHQVKLGALLNATRSSNEYSATQFGAFSFNSLEDFAADRPTSYSRSLTTKTRAGGGQNVALHVGDVWQYTPRLQLTYGLRLEGSLFGRTPEYNPRVDSLFGRRTDRFASEIDLSPRLGFTYTIPAAKGAPPAPVTIRGGIGVFRGRPPFSLYSTAMDATGLAGAQVQIACVGAAVPVPDWTGFRGDPTSIPDLCADNQAGIATSSGRAPNVTVFTPGFDAPRSWRTSLELERPLGKKLGVTLSATYNLGTDLYGVRDLNLDAAQRFTLPAENDRPVFVDPEAVVERSGQLALLASRIHPQLGQVLEVHSTLRSSSTQWTASLRGNFPPRFNFRAAYTLSAARDQSSFSCCSAAQGFGSPSTAGNPNGVEWSRSNFERRHSLLGTLGVIPRRWLELTVVGRAYSGAPFTPLVGNDINGDGARNDRAFVFAPTAISDSAVASGMTRLLQQAPAHIRKCLARQLGRIATRNSCRGSPLSSLEIRANLRPKLPGGIQRRATLSVASRNLLMGLDQLLSGGGRLRGWGQRVSPDPTLLYPRAFDRASRSFRYEVNERFGNARQGKIAIGSPFQLHIEARVTLGPQAPAPRRP